MEDAKQWKAELSAFVLLCKSCIRFLAKKFQKEDTAVVAEDILNLQRRSRKIQLVICGSAVLLLILIMRGCGSQESDERVTSGTQSKSIQTNGSSRGKLTAQEAVARIVNVPLWKLARVIEAPSPGEIWENTAPMLDVLQVIDGGVLVETRMGESDSSGKTTVFFVRTSRQYADNDKLTLGFYMCTGMKSYTTASGVTKTVHAFEELAESLQNEMRMVLAHREKEQAAARKMAEAKEREERKRQEKEQAEARKKADEEYRLKELQEREHPSSPEEFLSRVFHGNERVDLVQHRASVAFEQLRHEFVWQIFWSQNINKINAMHDAVNKAHVADKKGEYHFQCVLLFAKWLYANGCNSNQSFLDKFMPLLHFDKLDENLVIQKSLRGQVEVRYDRQFVKELTELQKKHDWVGLINIAFKDSNLRLTEMPKDIARWVTCNRAISRLSKLPIKAQIVSNEKLVWETIDKAGFRINDLGRDQVLRFDTKTYVHIDYGRKAPKNPLSMLRDDFMQKKTKICDEYKLSMQPNENEKEQKIKALEDEFVKAYEHWIETN